MRMDTPEPFSAHLEELRRRLLAVCASLAFFSALALGFMDILLEVLKAPAHGQLGMLAVFSPTEAIITFLEIAFSVGVILSVPVMLYEGWMFTRPAMDPEVARKGTFFITTGTLFFVLGAGFCYFFLLPASLKFLLQIGKRHVQFIISLDAYVSFALTFILGGGIVFETPIVVWMLAKLGILTSRMMVRQWRIAAILILITAAMITPTPDGVNMLIMAIPLFMLYFLSIAIAKDVEAKRDKR